MYCKHTLWVFLLLSVLLLFPSREGKCADSADIFGKTSLHTASSRGDVEIVELLLETGIDVNAKNRFGWTPLHLASSKGHIEIVEMLLQDGADRGIKNKFGRTSLDYAVRNNHTEIVRLLVREETMKDRSEFVSNTLMSSKFSEKARKNTG